MFKNIPATRLVIYLLLAGVLPNLFVAANFFSKKKLLETLQSQIESVKTSAFVREKRQAVNLAVQSVYREADHFYLDKEIETIQLLQPEIESLKKIGSNPNFTEDDFVKKRIDFLTGRENKIVFSEGIVQSTPLFQEVTETLVHPVEINTEDLKQMLAKIEGKEIGNYDSGAGRPQLVILDFKIEKKNIAENNEVFLLNLKLLKREFL